MRLQSRQLFLQLLEIFVRIDTAAHLASHRLGLRVKPSQQRIFIPTARARLAGVNRHRTVFFGEIFFGYPPQIRRGHRLDFWPSFIDLAPVTQTFAAHDLHQDRVIGTQPSILRRGKVVLHLLQFLGRHGLGFDLLNQPVDLLLGHLRRVAFGDLRAHVKLTRVLARTLPSPSVRRQFFAQHQLLVQPARARAEHLRQHA